MTGTYYLRDLAHTPTAFVLAIVLLVLCYPLLKLWDKAGGRYGFDSS
jgi:hypothetical protein